MKKNYKLVGLALGAFVFLSACGRGQVTGQSSGMWERFVYFFAEVIRYLSINGQIGIGIILFTLIIRTILLPLFNMQLKSGQKMQELQPELKALQAKYSGKKDRESRLRLTEETQELYKKHGVNPYASLWPLAIQMPVLLALYQALSRVAFLKEGTFLWVDIAKPDPYFILPILAAVFTFLSSWLTNKAAKERNGMMVVMTIVLPIFILVIGINMASGIALYWALSNAYQVFQILLLNNPFKIIAERQRLEAEARELEAKKRRAMKKARKKRR
ncbi:YidC/Oxa1 family membrane protein insertase [Streptococcus macacae]|uniref:Membrane protein insertase YidC n=1 Tax=Streptococcus macacae NCTC 11558 TaxID=764298 RepID=G5JWE5_9STRE|nr:YidC/Oxa1 family membrane protein insertase [Streptococcus macacae]EHJ52889.1 60Kd inner membrane protein [Streptococcus macacae NCTC 11558]SUN77799.1 preprotein translocase YidC subunit [Streptococcus macacae NCTC 11558]